MSITQQDLGIRIQMARMEAKKQSGDKYEERIKIYIDVIEEYKKEKSITASEALHLIFTEKNPEPWAQMMFLAALGEMILK